MNAQSNPNFSRSNSRCGRPETNKYDDEIRKCQSKILYIWGPEWSGVTTELEYIKSHLRDKDGKAFDHCFYTTLKHMTDKESVKIGQTLKIVLQKWIMGIDPEAIDVPGLNWVTPLIGVFERKFQERFLIVIDDMDRLRDINDDEEDIRQNLCNLAKHENVYLLLGSHADMVISIGHEIKIRLEKITEERYPYKFAKIIQGLPPMIKLLDNLVKDGIVGDDEMLQKQLNEMDKSELLKIFGRKDLMKEDRLDLRVKSVIKDFESVLENGKEIKRKIAEGEYDIQKLLGNDKDKTRFTDNLINLMELHSKGIIQRDDMSIAFYNAYVEDKLKTILSQEIDSENDKEMNNDLNRNDTVPESEPASLDFINIRRNIDAMEQFLRNIGICTLVYIALRIVWYARKFVRQFFLSNNFNFKACGEWAVVTGATDGIGKAYACQLAERGMKICLISRNPKKLARVAKELESQYNVETKTIAADCCKTDIYETIDDELKEIDIGVLVNNVGIGLGRNYVHNITDRNDIKNIIICNMLPLTMLSHSVLPSMIKKRNGIIINVGSISGTFVQPFKVIYGATKAYTDLFSRSLQEEVREFGIIVQSVLPSYVSTKLVGHMSVNFSVPLPEKYVRSALNTVGVESRTFGYIQHALQGLIFNSPESFYHALMKQEYEEVKKSIKSNKIKKYIE
ncbi:DgyrCDS5689 [Dimorphilus gyrociliatus]|uniref:DgyrCDS5689 n=1 Tax=Dimorphilus gyrociliatus TaxID=2664684 RepID=A0A7I8VMY9_9ANNE|nr:DgyrCDS5689 [Dimorphilus gyrociliatus]